MNSPNPVPQPSPGYTPSNSTNLTAVGGALGTIICAALGHFGWPVDGVTQGAIITVCATLLGYLPASGRR